MSIDYCGFNFTDPVPLLDAAVPQASGLFVIQLYDAAGGGTRFRPIAFGESANLGSAAFFTLHPSYESWVEAATHPRELFVSFFKAPLWNEACRQTVVSRLLQAYLARPAHRTRRKTTEKVEAMSL
jgi:hypothetical protein